jgi:hypothetical protein
VKSLPDNFKNYDKDLIESEIKKITNPMAVNKGYVDGLQTALSIIKKEIK